MNTLIPHSPDRLCDLIQQLGLAPALHRLCTQIEHITALMQRQIQSSHPELDIREVAIDTVIAMLQQRQDARCDVDHTIHDITGISDTRLFALIEEHGLGDAICQLADLMEDRAAEILAVGPTPALTWDHVLRAVLVTLQQRADDRGPL
jgi:hypothetical protein